MLEKVLLVLPVVGVLQFLICCIVAAQFYPGGSPFSLHNEIWTEGYSFWQNPVSDLGRCFAWNGVQNETSRSIYTPSLIFLAISAIPLALLMPARFRGSRRFLKLAAFAFTLSFCFMLGVAWTPYDTLLREHDFFFSAWLIAFSVALLLFHVAIRKRQKENGCSQGRHRVVTIVSWVTLGLVLLHIVQTYVPWQRQLYIPAQKIVAIVSLAWVAIASLSAFPRPGANDRLANVRGSQPDKKNSFTFLPLVAGIVLAILIGGWTIANRTPVACQVIPSPLFEAPPFVVRFANNTRRTLESIKIAGWVNGEIGVNEKLIVELWEIKDGKPSLLDQSTKSRDVNFVPTGLNSVFVSSIPIVVAERPEYGQPESMEIVDTPGFIAVFHPPAGFQTKCQWSYYDFLPSGTGLAIWMVSDQFSLFGKETLESVVATYQEGTGLLVTIRRELQD